jgi:hypothetical protein
MTRAGVKVGFNVLPEFFERGDGYHENELI